VFDRGKEVWGREPFMRVRGKDKVHENREKGGRSAQTMGRGLDLGKKKLFGGKKTGRKLRRGKKVS